MRTCKNVAALLCLALWLLWPCGARCQQRYRVAACDWMMLKRQKLGEFQLAKDIGADGVEVDMGALGQRVQFDNKLREEHFRRLFRHTADSLGISVSSMAMSGFFAQSLLSRQNYEELVAECLDAMQAMGTRVAFLPLGGSGHEWEPILAPEHRAMVARLRTLGQMAARRGMTIGIRTGMSALYDAALVKEIGSQGIKIYFNMQDAVDCRRDVCKELETLGAKNIVQIHASLTDSVTLDRDPRIDLHRVRQTLDRMGWSGWLVVERSRNANDVRNVKGNFGTNVRYLKEIFQSQNK